MDCQGVKQIIPLYVKHAASDHEAKQVEAHLCVCDECRQHLANVMDNPSPQSMSSPQEMAMPQKEATKKEIGTFEYAIVGVAAAMLLFFIYLFMK